MAAPTEVNIKNLSGKWVIDKELSDSTDPILSFQGIGWVKRRIIGAATITQHLKQYEAPSHENPSGEPVTHIDFDQVLTGGITGTSEKRTLDWQYRDHSDGIFGAVKGRSRWIKLDDLVKEYEGSDVAEDVKYLVEDWDEETKAGAVESWVKRDDPSNPWTAWQIWGFTNVDGQRRHVRRVVCRKGNEAKKARLVFNWIGKAD